MMGRVRSFSFSFSGEDRDIEIAIDVIRSVCQKIPNMFLERLDNRCGEIECHGYHDIVDIDKLFEIFNHVKIIISNEYST